jgi:hypothetical protein
MTDQERAGAPANTGEKLDDRNARGQFVKGARGNPRGKPRGARHRTTIIAETILAKRSRELLERAVEAALGDRGGPTLRALLPFIVAPHTARPLVFELPPLDAPSDAKRAMDAIAVGLREGRLTESETSTLAAVVGKFIDAMKIVDVEARLLALEASLNCGSRQ